jgi:hypothetical protein
MRTALTQLRGAQPMRRSTCLNSASKGNGTPSSVTSSKSE